MVHHGCMNRQSADAALIASLAAEIRAERARRDLTQAQVWTRAGISPSAYKKIENGQPGASRSIEQVVRIASALGIDAGELISRAEAGMSAHGHRVQEAEAREILGDDFAEIETARESQRSQVSQKRRKA